jgi:hypothetical protein
MDGMMTKIALLALLLVSAVEAQEAESDGQSLAQAASDPTASLMNVQLSDWYTANYWNLPDESANQFVIRTAYPFAWGKTKHIMRATVPFITSHPSLNSGLSDITLFDLLVFDKPWGRWGVGPVALLPTGGSDRGTEKWGLGPAVGFIVAKPKLIFGLFNQNIFTVAGDDARPDVNVSIIQPIVNHQLGGGWAVGTSEMSVTYNWDSSDWSSLPLGASILKMTKPGGIPVQWSFQYEYNFADDQLVAKNLWRLTAKLLFPTN